MGVDTEIAWCDHTFNPWWGCQRISPGCENCYAESFAKRVGHGKRLPQIWGPAATSERRFFGDAHWNEPRKWNAKAQRDGVRRRVFCASMADVFEDREDLIVPRERLFRLIDGTTHLDWLLLTKRPENVNRLVPPRLWGTLYNKGLPPNVWLGTTVEDKPRLARIDELRGVPARVRFLSCEPLLQDLGEIDLRGVDWVIVGGESGGGSRPFDIAWARSLRDQCRVAGLACFVKQLGSRPVESGLRLASREEFEAAFGHLPKAAPGTVTEKMREAVRATEARVKAGVPMSLRLKDRKGGDWSEWPEDLRVREWPTVTP